MQHKNELSTQNNIAFEYAKEILSGAVAGVMSIIDDILHPIDNVIYPISMLAYDSLIIIASHQNSLPAMDPNYPDLLFAQQAIHINPQLYHDAVSRMNQRVQNIQNLTQTYLDASGPQRSGMASQVATTILVPWKLVKGIKAAVKFNKFGITYTPPSFHNTVGDLPRSNFVSSKSLADIRSVQGTQSYIYVATTEGHLIIADRLYKSNLLEKYSSMVHHHDLAKNFPVYNAGEIVVKDGFIKQITNSSGHYLPVGNHLKVLTEKYFRAHGYIEAQNIYENINIYAHSFRNPIITMPNPGKDIHLGTGVGVLINERLKINQSDETYIQQQKAHELIVRSEIRHQAANAHGDQPKHQNILANTSWYNLSYNQFFLRLNTYDLVWRVEQQAIWEFKLRYGSCPSFVQMRISSQAQSLVGAYATHFGFNFNSFYSGLSDFSLVLMCTNLISSYNSYNYGSYMYSPWFNYGLIGGVAAETATLSDMVNSKAHALADSFYLCLPTAQSTFTTSMFEQIQAELFEGYKQGTLPFFSLHFNQHSYLYPVLHPAYQNTLIGLTIGFLDYWMKGFLNGGVFDEEFLKIWHETANCDETYLRSKMVDLKKYCKKTLPNLEYVSLRELESRYGIVTKASNSIYAQPFMTSFRIIAFQEKIERYDNILIPYPNFRIEYSVDMMPDYKHYVETYKKQHGKLPPEYEQTLLCYELFAQEIKDKMTQLPFCKQYFSLLGAINSLCYLYTTFEKMGKKPNMAMVQKEVYYPFPKSLPPIPVRYYQTFDLILNLKDILTVSDTLFSSKAALDHSLAQVFGSANEGIISEELKQHITHIVTSKITEFLKSLLPPEQVGELNDAEIQKMINNSIKIIQQIAKFNYFSVTKKCSDLINQLTWISFERKGSLKKLLLLEKIDQINQEQKTHFQSLKECWERNPASIYGGYELFIKNEQSVTHEKHPCLIKKRNGSYSFWGYKQRKWQYSELEKDFIFPPDWDKKEHVFILPDSVFFDFFKEAHSLDDGIFSVLSSKEDKDFIRKEFQNADTQVAAELQKFPNISAEQKSKIELELLQQKLKRCIDITTLVSDNYSKYALDLIASITQASDHMLAITKIADTSIATQYTHSFVSFTGSKLAKNMVDNFNIVGGCGFSLPDMESKPIPHAESFANAISQSFEKRADRHVTLKHNNIDYLVYRIDVQDESCELISKTETEQIQESSFGLLRAIHEKFLSPQSIKKHINKKTLDNKGTTLLHCASALLQPELFAEIINYPETSLLNKDHYGNLPIHRAVEAGNTASVEIMLKKNPDLVQAKNNQGVSPLMTAIQYGHLDIVKLFQVHAALFNECLPNGLFPLYMALAKNFTPIVLWMLDHVVGLDVNLQLDSKMTALHLSIASENHLVSLKLLEKGARYTIPRKSDGHTALHCAAQLETTELLSCMLNKSISIDLTLESKKTPLHLAAESGKLDAVKLLIQGGANCNSKTVDAETPLMLAIRAGHVDVAKWLAKVSLINDVNSQFQTASLLANQYAMPSVADILIQRGENCQLVDKKGINALYYLVRNGEYLRLKKLLTINLNFKQLFEGRNLLAVAAEGGHFFIVKLLETKCSLVTNSGISMLEYAIKADEVDYVRQHVQEIKQFKSAVICAIQCKATQSLSFLLKHIAQNVPQNIKEYLRIALETNTVKVVQLVLEYVDNINQELDKEGNTCLHLIVQTGAHFLLPLLSEYGADFTKRNQSNHSVFQIAIVQKDDDFLKRLFQHSRPEDWPLDLWSIEQDQLNEKIIKILNKYQKLLPQELNKADLNITEIKPLFKTELPACPILSELQYKLVNQISALFEQWNYSEVIKILAKHPFLYTVLKSEKGGELIQCLYANIIDFNKLKDTDETEYAFSGPESLVKLLVENNINPKDYLGKYNILFSIIKKQSLDEAYYLLDILENYFPDAIEILANDISTGTSPIELALQLRKNELFIKLDDLCHNKNNRRMVYSLHKAVASMNAELVAVLIKKYPVDALNDEGQTLLMLAASTGNISMIDLLLKNQAQVGKCDRYGRNVLYYALDQSASLEAALYILPLLKEPNQSDRFGITPFMRASAMGYVSVMRFINETNHNIHAVDDRGYNALHYAAEADQVQSITFLITHQFPVDQTVMPLCEKKIAQSRQQTALHLAAHHAKEHAFFELLRLGADPAKEDQFGFNVCEYGILSKNKDMQNQIKRFPWYHNPERDKYLLHAAITVDESAIVAELVLSKANLNAVNHLGQNALHIAALSQACESAKLLLRGAGMIVSLLDLHGYSPLHYAAQIGSVRLISLLGDAGAEMNQKTLDGSTALMLASARGHEGAVAVLLQYDIDFNQTNSHRLSAAQIALLNGYSFIALQIEHAGDSSLKDHALNTLETQDQKKLKKNLSILNANKITNRTNSLMRFYKPASLNNSSPIPESNQESKLFNGVDCK